MYIMKESSKFYTKKELDNIKYFQGNGIYAEFQDKRKNKISSIQDKFSC